MQRYPGQICCKPKLCLPKVLWTNSSNWWQTSHTSRIRCRWNSAWCWSQLLLSWWHVELWWLLLSCHYNQVLYCLRKVQEAPADPDIQAHIPHSLWEGVWCLCPLCSSSWKRNVGSDRFRLTAAPPKWQINDQMDLWHQAPWLISIDLLCARLGIQEVTAALRSKRLRHVVRSSSCIKSVANMEIPCSKVRGRPRKTWSDCVRADMSVCSLGGIDPQNRTAWRSGIRSSSSLLPTPATGTPAAGEK